MKNNPSPTVDEVVALLKKTSLPTVIVEGEDDLIVYNKLEGIYYDQSLSVLPVGGRAAVLAIFSRVNELPKSKKVIFIADRDAWVVTGVPKEYESDVLIFTDGYSIENDIFCDGDLCSYMSVDEARKFSEDLEKFLHWYSVAFDRYLKGEGEIIDRHPSQVLDQAGQFELLVALRDGERFPAQRVEEFKLGYPRLVRGKSLLALVIRQLSRAGRLAKHTDKSLMEHVAVKPGILIKRIISSVDLRLQAD